MHDVVIVGGGPTGSSCGYWLAQAGWDVVVVEKKEFPREKTCGDGLTPRAVRQLADMGLEEALAGSHRYEGLRAFGFGRSIDMRWPEHPNFPDYGYTITRHDLDGLVAGHAAGAGATLLQGTEVTAPLVDETAPPSGPLPTLTGVTVKEKGAAGTRTIRGRYVVVADGSNSRVGRMLGTTRRRDLPMGMALRGYYRSDRHDDPFIESHLDIRDAEGNVVPGYGWIFPMGDGRVNVGVGLLSTDQRWKGLNTSHLMDAFVAFAPSSWGLRPETSLGPPTGGKLPMGLSVGPRAGGNVLIAGDAGGAINPFNGEGIAYGYETGRLAAAALGHALTGGGEQALTDYDRELDGRLRPVLQGGAGLRPPDLEPRGDAPLRRPRHALGAAHDPAPAHHGQPDASRRRRPGRTGLPGHGARLAPPARQRRAREPRRLTRATRGARPERRYSGEQPLRTARHPQQPGALFTLEAFRDARRRRDPHPRIEGIVAQASSGPTLAPHGTHEPPDRPGQNAAPTGRGCGRDPPPRGRPPRSASR